MQLPTDNTLTAPGGPAQGYQNDAAGVKAFSAVEGFGQKVDRGVDQLDVAVQKVQQVDGRAAALQASTQANLDMRKQFEDMQNSSPPDGAGFYDNFKAAHNAYWDGVINNQTNPVAKKLLEEQQQQSLGTFGNAAIEWQAKAQRDNRIASLTGGIENQQKLLASMTPDQANSSVQSMLDATNDVIDNELLPPEQKQALKLKAQESLGMSAAYNMANADPSAFLKTSMAVRDPGALQSDPTAARGIRNNNPGNLKAAGQAGLVGTDDKGYAQFATPEAGIAAMGKQLVAYQDKHDINTIDGIINRWAPSSDGNNVSAYVQSMVKQTGFGADQQLNLHDPDTLQKITAGIIQHENGSNPYHDDAIAHGGQIATGAQPDGSTMPQPAPGQPAVTGHAGLDMLSWQQQRQMVDFAQQKQRQNMVIAKTSLEAQIQNSTSKAYNGIPDDAPPQLADFTAAYGPERGAAEYQKFQPTVQLGQDINSVATMTPAQTTAMLAARKPDAASPDFHANQDRYQKLQQAIAVVTKQRNDDPVAFAMQHNQIPQEALNFGNQQELAQQVTQRTQAMAAIHSTYGTPNKVLTDAEAKALGSTMEGLSVDGKLSLIGGLQQSMQQNPQMFAATMQQIRPDSPVTAMAGMYAGKTANVTTASHWFSPDQSVSGQQVAEHLILGEALLNPTKTNKAEDGIGKEFPMPPQKDISADFQSAAGTAFANNPQAAAQAYQAYKAYYAAEASKQGNYTGVLDPNISKQSASAVLGAVTKDAQGGDVLPPWGMDSTTFLDRAQSALKQQSPDTQWSHVGLEARGTEGQYRVKVGNGYLQKDGKPVVISVN